MEQEQVSIKTIDGYRYIKTIDGYGRFRAGCFVCGRGFSTSPEHRTEVHIGDKLLGLICDDGTKACAYASGDVLTERLQSRLMPLTELATEIKKLGYWPERVILTTENAELLS